MYQVKCDGYILFDPRDDELIVDSPKVNLEVNTVGEGSFTIHPNHPYYGRLKKLKSVFEVSDEIGVIFRGRMTENSYDFNNSTFVDLEGAMAYFNDSIVRPYTFPDDWANDAGYLAAASSGNVIEFFLKWLIEQHNVQVADFQRFKLGKVTVTDPNNYLSRSDSKYPNTWETLKSKLFDSGLGGYLCIRYETDGNYIDYLSDFELTNTQEIVFSENLLDLKTDSDATETYSAVIPIGADMLTIAGIADGNITDDIVKQGDMIYSKSAVEAYGWIFAPVSATTWDDVTVADNLLSKGVAFLTTDGLMLTESMEAKAIDLHFTDTQVQSFRIYRKVKVRSGVHGYNGVYQMPKLALDLQKPQNTVITVGATHRTLTEQNAAQRDETKQQYDYVLDDLKNIINKTDSLENKIEGIDGLFFYIKYSAYADGHVMTDAPNDSTEYMGTCSTNVNTAPTDYREYTWCQVKGDPGEQGVQGVQGKDGKTSYLHIKYSDDGETFTANNGETLGAWIGTLVDFTEADSTVFSDYTWKKFTEDVDEELDEIRRTITEQSTSVLKTSEEILLSALKSYVETSNFEEFKATLQAEFEVWSEGITGRVSASETNIKNVDGDLQEKYNLITKYFNFDINGLQIGSIDGNGNVSPNKVVIDNDDITILVNNMPIQTFRADGTALIPELKIKTSMNLLGLNITQDENHINCDFIGAVT